MRLCLKCVPRDFVTHLTLRMSTSSSRRPFVKDANGAGYMVVRSDTITGPGCFSPSLGPLEQYGKTNEFHHILLKDPHSSETTRYALLTAGMKAAGTKDFNNHGILSYVFTAVISRSSFNAMTHGLDVAVAYGSLDDVNACFQMNVSVESGPRVTLVSSSQTKEFAVPDFHRMCGTALSCEVLLAIKVGQPRNGGQRFFSATLKSCNVVKKYTGPIPEVKSTQRAARAPSPVFVSSTKASEDIINLLTSLKI